MVDRRAADGTGRLHVTRECVRGRYAYMYITFAEAWSTLKFDSWSTRSP